MIDANGKYIGQATVQRAGWLDRAKFRIRTALAEFINTDYASSGRLLEHIGDADTDTTERHAAHGRWSKIEKLRRMYKAEAARGNQYVRGITDFHAALQMGSGVRTTTVDPSADPPEDTEELKVWDAFLDFNDLDAEGAIDLGVAGELDGQVLLRFQPDPAENNVRAWIVPLLETRYRVEFSNPWRPARAILHPGTSREEVIPPEEFAFVRLRGTPNGSYGVPTCANVITEIEGLDLALKDLRQINKLFAHPTPIFKGKTPQSQKRIEADLLKMNWKLGMALVLTEGDEFNLHTLPPGALESMFREIVTLVQVVSGASFVPVHFLGFPDLMSNRAVADVDMEVPVIHAKKAQKRFQGFFERVRDKVFPMLSGLHGRDYDAGKVKTSFPDISKTNVKGLMETYLPARIAGEISRQYFLESIGHPDPEAEIEALEEERGAGRNVPDDEADEEARRIEDIIRQAREGA